MEQKQFQKVIKEQIELCTNLLGVKGDAYNFLGTDRLASFKKAGAIQSQSPEEALRGMWAKHLVSVCDMCAHPDDFAMDVWNEKITDTINYALLLKALLVEREDRNNEANRSKDTQ